MYHSLKKKELEKMRQSIINYVQKYSKDNKGEVSFIGIEYYYDGEIIDVGVRVRVRREDSVNEDQEDSDNYSDYESIFDETSLKPYFDSLIKYIENAKDYEETELIYGLLIENVNELTAMLNEVNWSGYAVISEDFEIIEPIEYD